MLAERNPSVAALKRLIAGKHFPLARRLLEAVALAGFHVEKVQTLNALITRSGGHST